MRNYTITIEYCSDKKEYIESNKSISSELKINFKDLVINSIPSSQDNLIVKQIYDGAVMLKIFDKNNRKRFPKKNEIVNYLKNSWENNNES